MKQFRFTPKQGFYLAFIHNYALLHGRPPSEIEICTYMRVSQPAAHTMIQSLAKRGLLSREPGAARSIRVLVPPEQLPSLDGTPPAQPAVAPSPKKDLEESVRPSDLISLEDAARISGYSAVRLRALAAEGKLTAWHIGNSWITTKRNVEEFLHTDTERRPPRSK